MFCCFQFLSLFSLEPSLMKFLLCFRDAPFWATYDLPVSLDAAVTPHPWLTSSTWPPGCCTHLACCLLFGCFFSFSCVGSSLSLTFKCLWTSSLHTPFPSLHLTQSQAFKCHLLTSVPSTHPTHFSCSHFWLQLQPLHPSFIHPT